jgi:hypothetical protein
MSEIHPCHTRITNKNCQYFADGVHKFYLEYCCMRPCIEGQNRCKSCIKIHKGARSQFDSTYPHGHMSEPIPEHSHIFGGKWYHERVHDWGEPSTEVVALALQHQQEARQFYTIPIPSKADAVSKSYDMGRPKKVATEKTTVLEAPASVPNAALNAALDAVPVEEPKKRTRKPKVGTLPASTADHTTDTTAVVEVEPPKVKAPPKPRKKPTKPKEEPAKVEVQQICKEVVIPTYIEEKIEELDTAEYETEFVILTFIEIQNTTYYQDIKKQKLYQIIKNKQIGPYVGRYCPRTETICTDVPDSDEEKDE